MSALIYNPFDKSFTYDGKTVNGLFDNVEFELDQDQIQHFIVELFDEFIAQKSSGEFRIAVKQAGTNTGKTTVYPYFVKLLMEFGLINVAVVITANLGVLSESNDSIGRLFSKSLENRQTVGRYESFVSARKEKYVKYKIILVSNESLKIAVNNGEFDRHDVGLVIIDEVHDNFATSHNDDARIDMGVNKAGDMKRLKSIQKVLSLGIPVVGLTGTTSASQEEGGGSLYGHLTYSQIGQPFKGEKDNNRAIRVNSIFLNGLELVTSEAVKRVFERQSHSEQINNKMSPSVLRVLKGVGLNPSLPRNALVACGPDFATAINSINISKVKDIIIEVAKEKNIENYNIVEFNPPGSESVLHKFRSTGKVQIPLEKDQTPASFADMFLNPENSDDEIESNFLDSVTFMLVVYKGNSGENIYNVTDLIFCRNSTVVEICRRERQLIGRIKRQFPGVRSHKSLIKKLKDSHNAPSLSSDDLDTLYEFLVNCATADVYFGYSSDNADSAVDITMNDVYSDTEIGQVYGKELYGFLWTSSIRRINGSDIIKKKYCEECATDSNGLPECYHKIYSYLVKTYGKEHADSEIERVYSGVLEGHHKDGNHLNQDVSNHITICANVHRAETMYNKHYLNRYPEIE